MDPALLQLKACAHETFDPESGLWGVAEGRAQKPLTGLPCQGEVYDCSVHDVNSPIDLGTLAYDSDDAAQPVNSDDGVLVAVSADWREEVWVVPRSEKGKRDAFSFTGLRHVECADGRTWVSWCSHPNCNTSGNATIFSGRDFKDLQGKLGK